MPGAYCRYCDHRCFVDRIIPDTGRRLHMATCPAGKAHDRSVSGFDADTAINPVTGPPSGQCHCRCGRPATANAYGHSCARWPLCERPNSAREQQLLDMLNSGGWADAPWERAPELDDDTRIAFRAQACNLDECHHPVHALQRGQRTPRRHIEWFDR